MMRTSSSKISTALFYVLMGIISLLWVATAEAATLSVNPATGVYQTGSTFTVTVRVNTMGQTINAADGTLSFNPRELSVVSVSRGSSIFNLWTAEPSFSNSAGTISFSGGSPSGYTGSGGTVMTVTFRSLTSGTARVSMTAGSVLAADGRGTNVLSTMGGGTYTLTAAETQPAPEVVIEYVPPANTPAAPVVRSSTHADATKWHTATKAELSWTVPAGVTAVRTLLNSSPTAVPSRVYEPPINSITLDDLEEGVQYFHIQFRNSDGWGRVTHYRLAVDSVKPDAFTISLADDADLTNPIQTLVLDVTDATSPVERFLVQIDGGEPEEYIVDSASSTLTLPALTPGYHTVIIEAFDAAGNSLISTFSFTILAFDKPVFTEYPERLNAGVIPVVRGQTRPRSEVQISLRTGSADPERFTVMADADGVFTYIPDDALTQGVYRLVAVAIDEYGAQSEPSEEITIVVEVPGFIAIGSLMVSVLSVIIPLVALLLLMGLMLWYFFFRFRLFRRRVSTESTEAMTILHQEFDRLKRLVTDQEAALVASRKTQKLTKAEADLITTLQGALRESEARVQKEIKDVSDLTPPKS